MTLEEAAEELNRLTAPKYIQTLTENQLKYQPFLVQMAFLVRMTLVYIQQPDLPGAIETIELIQLGLAEEYAKEHAH